MSLSLIIIIVVMAVVILVLLNLVSRVNVKGIDKIHFKNEWDDITKLAIDPKTSPMSVINADKLLNEALKCLGFTGNTMAERLISAKRHIKSKDQVWSAHKLRNKLVHETGNVPSKAEIKVALKGYYKAFKELGVL